MSDGRPLLYSGSDPSGAMGIYIEAFEAGRDTLATFAVSPDGTGLVHSGSDTQQTLMLAEGLDGIASARGGRRSPVQGPSAPQTLVPTTR